MERGRAASGCRLDYIVSRREKRRRNIQTDLACAFPADDQQEAGRLIDTDIARFFASQDGVDHDGRLAAEIEQVWRIGCCSTGIDVFPERIERGQTMPLSEVGNQAAVRQVLSGVAVLHGSVGGRTEPTPSLCLSDADGRRVSKLKHAVQGLNGDGDLRRATPVRPRTQCISDHSFKPADS